MVGQCLNCSENVVMQCSNVFPWDILDQWLSIQHLVSQIGEIFVAPSYFFNQDLFQISKIPHFLNEFLNETYLFLNGNPNFFEDHIFSGV